MFNLNHSQENDNSERNNIKSDFLNFSQNSKREEVINSLTSGNKFVQEDLNIRNMVIEMLEKEFGKNIKNIKGYDFLVDSVVNKLKNKQLSNSNCMEENV